jgi:hypothetical protein
MQIKSDALLCLAFYMEKEKTKVMQMEEYLRRKNILNKN